jgi:NSS family neurotransmitter:Na+ symporter
VWLDAYAQIFFTLSLGFGIMVAYASYLPRKSDINLNACVTSVVDTVVSIVAGFAVFGTLGYMAQQTGKPFEAVVQQSIGLAFVAYPQAVSLLPALRPLFGVYRFVGIVTFQMDYRLWLFCKSHSTSHFQFRLAASCPC